MDKEKSDFTLGFVVGVLTGVAGYFLTRTKEGKDLRSKVSSEWGSIRKRLEEEGLIQPKGKDFSDVIFSVRTKIMDFLDEDDSKHKGNHKSGGKNPVKRSKRGSGVAGKFKSKVAEKSAESEIRQRKKMFKGV